MLITLASVNDSAAILGLQKLAYQSEAAIYNDFRLPPLTETSEDWRSNFSSRVVLKAVDRGRIIGSVRAYQIGLQNGLQAARFTAFCPSTKRKSLS